MTCAKCNHGFCWRCLKSWKPNHKDYYNCSAMVSGRAPGGGRRPKGSRMGREGSVSRAAVGTEAQWGEDRSHLHLQSSVMRGLHRDLQPRIGLLTPRGLQKGWGRLGILRRPQDREEESKDSESEPRFSA